MTLMCADGDSGGALKLPLYFWDALVKKCQQLQ